MLQGITAQSQDLVFTPKTSEVKSLAISAGNNTAIAGDNLFNQVYAANNQATAISQNSYSSLQNRNAATKTSVTEEIDGIIKELATLFKRTEKFTYYDTKNKENITYIEQTFTKDQIVQRIKYGNDIVTFKYKDMPWQNIFSVSVRQTKDINKDLYHVFVTFKYGMDQAISSTKDPTPSTDTTNMLILEIKKEDVESATLLVEKLKAASDKSRS